MHTQPRALLSICTLFSTPYTLPAHGRLTEGRPSTRVHETLLLVLLYYRRDEHASTHPRLLVSTPNTSDRPHLYISHVFQYSSIEHRGWEVDPRGRGRLRWEGGWPRSLSWTCGFHEWFCAWAGIGGGEGGRQWREGSRIVRWAGEGGRARVRGLRGWV